MVTGLMLKVLGGFHHQAAWWIVGIAPRRAEDVEWDYSPVADALEAAGLWPIKEYL